MIGKPITGRSFGGCVRYLVNRPEASILDGEGLRLQSARSITSDFNQQRKLNPDLGKAVGHTILSWSARDSEKLTDEIMVGIAKSYMEKMGIRDTQYLIVRHADRKHPHIHLVYNRVDNQGKTITDNNNYRRNVAVCRALTERYGFYFARGKQEVDRQRLKGNDKVRYAIYDALKSTLETACSWQQLASALEQDGISILCKYRSGTDEIQGISFVKDGLVFKGSAIDRGMGMPGINKKLRENIYLNRQKNKGAELFFSNEKTHYNEPADSGTSYKNGPGPLAKGIIETLEILFRDEYLQADYNPFEQELKRRKKKKKNKNQERNQGLSI